MRKTLLSLNQCKLLSSGTFLSRNGIKYTSKADLQFQNPYQIIKSEKYETFCSSKLLICRKMGRRCLAWQHACSSSSAAWLAQLVECQSAVQEVEGSSPRPDQHSGS